MHTALAPLRSRTARADAYFDEFLNRTSRLIEPRLLKRLRQSRLLIAGCGGVGGAVALTLARLGVGQLVLADPGVFDAPDVNRQWAADSDTLGRNKAEVVEHRRPEQESHIACFD